MELNIRIVILLVLLLVAALVFATLMMGWGKDVSTWSEAIITPLKNLLLGK